MVLYNVERFIQRWPSPNDTSHIVLNLTKLNWHIVHIHTHIIYFMIFVNYLDKVIELILSNAANKPSGKAATQLFSINKYFN